jgi:hypothetical protein
MTDRGRRARQEGRGQIRGTGGTGCRGHRLADGTCASGIGGRFANLVVVSLQVAIIGRGGFPQGWSSIGANLR